MARYRKVDVRIWNDDKFLALTERGKLVFLFLMTHPNMTMLGAMRATIPGLAAEISIPVKGFGKAFQEALSKGMVMADQKACLIWLPNFLKYNKPESPNVVKSWPEAFDLLPECELKNQVLIRSKGFVGGFTEAFQEAFATVFTEGRAKGMPNQEQEPEPEQEREPEQEGENTSPTQTVTVQVTERPPKCSGDTQTGTPTGTDAVEKESPSPISIEAPPIRPGPDAAPLRDFKAGSTENIPDGLSPLQYAIFVLNQVGVSAGYELKSQTGDAIEMLARNESCTLPVATRHMLERMRVAAKTGVKVKFWLEDGGWKTPRGISIEG